MATDKGNKRKKLIFLLMVFVLLVDILYQIVYTTYLRQLTRLSYEITYNVYLKVLVKPSFYMAGSFVAVYLLFHNRVGIEQTINNRYARWARLGFELLIPAYFLLFYSAWIARYSILFFGMMSQKTLVFVFAGILLAYFTICVGDGESRE